MLTLLWYSVVVLDIFLLIVFFLIVAISLAAVIHISYDWIKGGKGFVGYSRFRWIAFFVFGIICTYGVFFESKNKIVALPFVKAIEEKIRSNEEKALLLHLTGKPPISNYVIRPANIEPLLPNTPEKIEIKKIITQLCLFENKKTKLVEVKNHFEKICLEIREDLRQKKVFSSKDLTTPTLRALATELAEVVTKKEAVEKQIIEIDRLLEVGHYATRRLSRATMINDAENEEVKGQLGQFSEILSELDNKFRGGTVSVAQSVDKITDEQLKAKTGEKK